MFKADSVKNSPTLTKHPPAWTNGMFVNPGVSLLHPLGLRISRTAHQAPGPCLWTTFWHSLGSPHTSPRHWSSHGGEWGRQCPGARNTVICRCRMKLLQLLSGTKSVGKVLEQLGCDVTSLDFKRADINTDI